MSTEDELTKTTTEQACPKCKIGVLISHTNAENIVVKETCSKCELVNDVLDAKLAAEAEAKTN